MTESKLPTLGAGKDVPVPVGVDNPANKRGPVVNDQTRISMSTPTRKLEIDESQFPGYHLYWFLGRNVPRAQRGGYEFVEYSEVNINQLGVANEASLSGSADLGTRVTVVAGEGADGQPEHLYLMKIKREWYEEDQKQLELVNNRIMDAIMKKRVVTADGERRDDMSARYVKQSSLQQPYKQPLRRP